MNATLSDENLVRSLRARADLALPTMSLDPAETVVAGRRHRRRRTAGTVATAMGGVAVLAFGVVVGTDALAPEPQEPAAFGTEQVVPLAAGLSATNRLEPHTDAAGHQWWETGLVFDLAVLDPAGVAANPTNPSADTGVALQYRERGEVQDVATFGRTTLVWRSDDTASDYAGRTYPSTLDTTYRWDDVSNPTMLTGAVPRGITDPRVVIYFPSDLVRGDSVSYVEVPTFRSPTADGRLLYAVQISPHSTTGDGYFGPIDHEGAWLGGRAFPVVVGADGTPFLNAGCSGTLAECYAEQPDGGETLREAIASVGGRVDG